MPLTKRLKLLVCDTEFVELLASSFRALFIIFVADKQNVKALPAERVQLFNNGGHILQPIEFADNRVHLELDAVLLTPLADPAKLLHDVRLLI